MRAIRTWSVGTLVLWSIATMICHHGYVEAEDRHPARMEPEQAPSAGTSSKTLGVVLRGEEALWLLDQCSRSTPPATEGLWEPTAATIEVLEELLPAYVMDNPPALAPDLVEHVSKYKRQYTGVVRGGRQIIYVNLFDDELQLGWRQQAVIMCDGGAAYWGIEFDVETRTFSNLEMNGEA